MNKDKETLSESGELGGVKIDATMKRMFSLAVYSSKDLPHIEQLKVHLEEKVQEFIDDGLWLQGLDIDTRTEVENEI